jgi:hypothetical protein
MEWRVLAAGDSHSGESGNGFFGSPTEIAKSGGLHGQGGGCIRLGLSFDLEPKDIRGMEDSFKESVANDIADSVAGLREKIHIVDVQPGSIPVCDILSWIYPGM